MPTNSQGPWRELPRRFSLELALLLSFVSAVNLIVTTVQLVVTTIRFDEIKTHETALRALRLDFDMELQRLEATNRKLHQQWGADHNEP